jgi:hypothetical protein
VSDAPTTEESPYVRWERDTFKALAGMDLDIAYTFLAACPPAGAGRWRVQLAYLHALRTGLATGDLQLAVLELYAGLPDNLTETTP